MTAKKPETQVSGFFIELPVETDSIGSCCESASCAAGQLPDCCTREGGQRMRGLQFASVAPD
ncbi:hypothetical protein OU994_18770 [Pseudoduganella sp. SL102]|uniref:hypothetical protein n=1 Tax=Pseudoduganella sp. SL102 TaxID=2995154 RepID=UPI00248D283B|nr:hypothetical protein [Pseudoduganella sp. SL102]WBS00352.1 hypothetical protein OU994_18770 [Pseudoduganella sp. SL102]